MRFNQIATILLASAALAACGGKQKPASGLHTDTKEVPPPPELVEAMTKLTDKLGLDYAAADLKTNPRNGRLEFLEVNTMPMFTGYDDAAKGKLSDAIFLTLRKMEKRAAPQPKTAPKP